MLRLDQFIYYLIIEGEARERGFDAIATFQHDPPFYLKNEHNSFELLTHIQNGYLVTPHCTFYTYPSQQEADTIRQAM